METIEQHQRSILLGGLLLNGSLGDIGGGIILRGGFGGKDPATEKNRRFFSAGLVLTLG
jgi:hypothetical protein